MGKAVEVRQQLPHLFGPRSLVARELLAVFSQLLAYEKPMGIDVYHRLNVFHAASLLGVSTSWGSWGRRSLKRFIVRSSRFGVPVALITYSFTYAHRSPFHM